MRLSLSKYLARFQSRRAPRRRVSGPDPFRKRPHLEYLEDRVVPSIYYSSTGSRSITDTGGPILNHMQLDLIYWGTHWNDSGNQTLRTNVQNTANAILNSSFFDVLAQYRSIGHGSVLRTDTITSSSPGSTFQTGPNGDLATMVANNINNGTLPSPNGQILYFVVPQPGSTPNDCGCSGRHLAGIASNNRVFPYGLTTDPVGIALDSLSDIMSHEMAEAASNPEWNITVGNVSQAAFHVPNSNGDEIGDAEAQNYTYRLQNGVLIQSMLSQQDHAYVVTNGTSQHFLVSSSGALTVNGDQLANHNDTITVDTVGSDVKVTLNGETVQFEPGTIHSITVNSGSGTDTINVFHTLSSVPLTITSGGTATVNLGFNGSVQGIQSAVSISNPPNYSTINIDDSNDTTARNVTVSSSAITGLLPFGATITYAQTDLAGLTIKGGSGGNTFTVVSTPFNVGQHPVTTIHTGAGTGTVNVRGTSGALVINGDSGTETVNVGSQAPNLNGTLTGITGSVTVTNTSSTSALSVDDSGDTTGRTGTISSTAVTGFGMPSGVAVNYTGSQLSSLTVRAGSGGNTATVTGTSTSTTLHGGSGGATLNVQATSGALTINGDNATDTINVGSLAPNLGGTLHNITGAITVTNTSSTSTLSLDDGADAFSQASTISGTAVTGFGMPSGVAINYTGSQLSSLTVRGGDAPTVAVTGTSTPTTLHMAGGGTVNVRATSSALTITGDNAANTVTVNVGSQAPNLNGTLTGITGSVTVTNTSSTSTLSVDDSGDSTARTGTITGTAVTGLGMGSGAAINYTGSQLSSLTVRTGSGGAAVTVSGTSTSTSLIGNASGSNTLVGPNAATTWNVTGSNAGSLAGLNLTFSGFRNLTGGSAADNFVFSNGASVSGTVNGGGGSDTLNLAAYTTPVTVNLQAATATGVGSFANIQGFTGGSASNTLIGPDAATTWNISGSNAGTVAGDSFTAFQNLTGGAGDNSFVFSDGAGVSGTVTGGGGNNTLNYSLYSTPVTVNLQAGTATGTGAFVNVQNFIGGGAANTLVGPAAATTWNIGGSNVGSLSGGYTFSLFQNLTGGAGDNAFVFSDGAALTGTLTGGGGNNTLDTSAYSSSESFSITGANAGTASVVPVFSGIQNLVGGSAATTFSLSDGGSLSGTVNGGSGTATLDYSSGWSGDVVVNLQVGLASGVAGGVSSIRNVNGANGGGSGFYNILIGNGGNTLTGGNGRRNLLEAGGAASTLIGGNDDDILIGGTTAYDSEADAHDFIAIMTYWAGTADDYGTRVNNLLNGNGVPALNAATVFNNGGGNTLQGNNGGPGELNLFYGLDPTLENTDYNPGAGEQFITV